MKPKFPSGKYAEDRKWLLLEAKCRSFNRFFKLPFALLLVPTYGQRRPGLGKLGIRKTIFYKPMGLVCLEGIFRLAYVRACGLFCIEEKVETVHYIRQLSPRQYCSIEQVSRGSAGCQAPIGT